MGNSPHDPAGPAQRSRIEVSWHVSPRTFWRRALFGKLRRRQMGDEVPDSLRALGALLARPSAVGTVED